MVETHSSEKSVRSARDEPRAIVMFCVAIAFLALFAALLSHGRLAEAVSERLMATPAIWGLLLLLWLIVIIEGIVGYIAAPDKPKNALFRLLLVALVPPFRMTISPLRPNTHVWLPKFDWLRTGKLAVERMEVRTAMPMLAVTVLILPVLAADFLVGPRPHDLLAVELESVERFDTSDNGMRLFMLDETERVVANVSRPDHEIRKGIEGNWIVLGNPEGAETSTLSLGLENTFTFRTGCSVTEGTFASQSGALSFDDVTKTGTCPPSWLEIVMWFVTSFIWFCFALEFILLVSLADKKLDFCKRNWINIVIILLPLLAFLRSLQLFRFLRMAKAGKLMRVYRLRGIITRLAKLATLFNLIERMLSRNPDKYGSHLREKIAEKEEELDELKQKLATAETKP